jgi:hypothetical protein
MGCKMFLYIEEIEVSNIKSAGVKCHMYLIGQLLLIKERITSM